ncbi:MAG TPA: trigger factor [Solirubrobacterales bacterium]|nr:trigger factor [Solirubrobacterales bacterium]
MQTTHSELPDSRARVEVEVSAKDVEKAISRAARGMAKEMRLPGFRQGKAPASLVTQRLGFGPVLQEAIREALPEWYENALIDSGVSPIGDPQIEMVSTPDAEGEPLSFSFEVGVRPPAKLGEYKGLEVGKGETEVPDEIVDREIDRVREGFARLEPVERASAEGDSLLIDFEGLLDGKAFEGGKAEDYLLSLGSGQLIEGFEEQLTGAAPGEDRTITVTFPEDYQAEHLAGEEAQFNVKVKEVREKILPELDDDFASDASEFDTLEELRAEVREKVGAALGSRAEEDFRIAAIDAAVDAATVEVPADLVTARATERWERMERQLAGRGMDPNTFLQMQGKTRDELIEESKPDAERELQRESVVTAIAEAEAIEVTDEELIEALEHSAEHERTTPEKLLERLRANGRDAMVREDIRARKAIELVADAATPIPLEQAEARDQIWTPEKEREKAGGLWTPDDGE